MLWQQMSVEEYSSVKAEDINIPPNGVALWTHVFRAAYYADHVWGQFLMAIQVLPLPEEWGWKYDSGKLIPDGADLPEASSAVRDLVKCRCNPEKGCHGRCKCVNALPSCSELCMHKGECERDDRSQWTQTVIGLIVFLEKQVLV